MERLVVVLERDTPCETALQGIRMPPGGTTTDVNAADPLNRRTRTRPDHNRVRDIPSPVSVLGLAPPPPRRVSTPTVENAVTHDTDPRRRD